MHYINIESEYNIIDKIGSGSYGDVYDITTKDGKRYAMKISYLDQNIHIRPETLKEVSNLKKLKHNHIIDLHYVDLGIFKNKKCIYLLLDRYNFTLFELHTNDMIIFSEILKGVQYLHSNGFCHGDLSFTNIMVDKNGISTKIIDFGFARRLYRKYAPKPSPMIYPPNFEQLSGEKIDYWGLGCHYYKFITSQFLISPSNLGNQDALDEKIKKINVFLTPEQSNTFISYLNYNPPELNKNIPKTQINTVKNNIYEILSPQDKFVVNNLIKKIIDVNNMEFEILFLTLYNAKQIIYTNDIYKYSGGNLLNTFIVLFWLSSKIISENIFTREKLEEQCHIATGIKCDIETLSCLLCQCLNWDLDGNNLYNLIRFIPEEFKKMYEIVIYFLEINNYVYTDFNRTFNGIHKMITKEYFLENVDCNEEIFNIRTFIKNVCNNLTTKNLLIDFYGDRKCVEYLINL